MQPDGTTALVVEGQVASALISSIDAGHVDQHFYELGAYLVLFNLNWVFICGDVYLGDHIEEVSLLYLG